MNGINKYDINKTVYNFYIKLVIEGRGLMNIELAVGRRGKINKIDEIYKSTITLLVEADKKRDQILLFYATTIGLFLEFILPIYEKNPYLFFIINLVVIIASVIIGLTIISLRKWHTIYVATASVLQNLMINKRDKGLEKVKVYWNEYVKDYNQKLNFTTTKNEEATNKNTGTRFSTENLVFVVYLVISTIPILTMHYFSIKYFSGLITNLCNPFDLYIRHHFYSFWIHESHSVLNVNSIWIILLFLIFYIFTMLYIHKKCGVNVLQEGNINGWVLQNLPKN